MNEIKRTLLCGEKDCCPEVIVDSNRQEVAIGEEGNIVKLKKQEWNSLIEKIKTGELTSL